MQLTEGGLKLRPRNLRDRAKWLNRGTLTWSTPRGAKASVSFRVVAYAEEAEVFLDYQVNGAPVHQRILCDSTVQHDGGRRWWFMCPGCDRRMEVLYLPPRQKEFKCRRCYKLRYPSQERDLDFLLKPMAAAAGVPRRIARKYWEEVRKMPG
jgi:hypothetical protein